MKNFAVLLILTLAFSTTFAQKKNGTVYNEHPDIEKTRQLWKAFANGDVETYRSFYADSIGLMRNGQYQKIANGNFGNNVTWWKNNIENLSIKDDTPAYPDAIEYADGGIWVQDWLLVTGTHKASGINLDLRIHNLYSFNKEGKIAMLIQYFDNSVFEEISNSNLEKENGKVFINHPYIVTVRKLVNAYAAEDMETLLGFYADNARFGSIEYQWDNSIDLETRKEGIKETFDKIKDIHFKQNGYPDCIYYAKNNRYEVYSWWEYSFTYVESGKKVVMPLMLSHSFNDDGKIVAEQAYYSTNHFDR